MRDLMMRGSQIAYDADGGVGGTGGTGGDGGQAATWYTGADAELIGHIQTKGWHELTPDKAALAAVQAHREAERFVGVPADRVIKLPADAADEAGWKAAWSRLGVPADAKEYDFSSLVGEDKQPLLDTAEQDWLRATAHKLNVPKDAATQLAQEIVKHRADAAASAATEGTARLQEEHKMLEQNWGANMEANKFVARKGAEKLGLDATAVDALEKIAGYAKTMEALRRVGELSGEAKFFSGPGPNRDGIMTREQAVSRKADLMQDQAWVKRYMDGGVTEKREMEGLLTLIVGDDTAASASR